MNEKLHRAAMPKWRRKRLAPPPLTVAQILAWADEFYEVHGRWPRHRDGCVRPFLEPTWLAVDKALRIGRRGLPGGSSLSRLLAKERGARNIQALPDLTERRILGWADAFHKRTGSWPIRDSGIIPNSGGESWQTAASAPRRAARGLQCACSLADLLARHRGARNHMAVPRLTEELILRWADAYHPGRWPGQGSGRIQEAPGETWLGVNTALDKGVRGLPGGSSIAQLLTAKRGVRNIKRLHRLTARQVLAWADSHHRRTGKWPNLHSGQILDAEEGQTWSSIENAFRRGSRGLRGGSSLHRFLRRHRRITVRN